MTNEKDTSDPNWPYSKNVHDDGTIFVRKLSKEFRQKFKSWCTLKGFTMNGAILSLMKKAIETDIELDPEIAKYQEKQKG